MSNGLLILVAVGVPLASAPLLALAGRRMGRRVGLLALAAPLLSTAALLVLALRVGLPGSLVVEMPWIPSLGISLSFLVDGLSLFFALIVSGIGVLVVWYATAYLDDHHGHHGRFYAYLILFMASMLGTVLSNNLMLLFVFWELTGLSSFLLIGFLHGEEKSRVGARQALLVTGFTGLLLLAGILMVRQVTGSLSLSTLLASPLPLEAHRGWLTAAMGLMILGAFGKSAQFPFHFWLPNAMAAPTPVSAYLHSATMVKLGVFLCARIFPLFASHELWTPFLAWIGFGTMLLGAVLALLSHDLKAILAYSTVSGLGSFIGLYGLGTAAGVQYDYLHVLNHVLYKGCLFMVAGAVIHSTGVQDIRKLGGLFRRMPMLGVTAGVAAATMAGLPLTTGFLSKETMLETVFGALAEPGALGVYVTVCLVTAAALKVAFSLRLFAGVFLGPEAPEAVEHFHRPSLGLQIPPLALAVTALVLGTAPAVVDGISRALAVDGLHRPGGHLQLWHGVTPELLTSAAIILAGLALYAVASRARWRWSAIPRILRLDIFFERRVTALTTSSKWITRSLGADQPLSYVPIILAFLLAVVGGYTVTALAPSLRGGGWLPVPTGAAFEPLRALVAALISLAVLGVIVLRRWTTQLISLSVAGFLTTFFFVLYRAPDLALTQILVEVVSLVLVLVLLGRFPRAAEESERTHRPAGARQVLNVVLSLGVGALVTVLVLWMTSRPHPDRLGPWFAANTVGLAEGSNAVNTILVDFRGLDTLGEITVLLIATLGVLGLLMRRKRDPGGDSGRAPAASHTGMRFQGPRSVIFSTVVRPVFFLVNIVAFYLLLRGHNSPGGGFIAGLVSGISLVLLSLGVGVEQMHRIVRFDPVRLSAAGLGLSALTGLAPWLAGRAFLEHFSVNLPVPGLGEIHVGTALAFDLGVYLVVVGIVTKVIFVFTKSSRGLRALVEEEEELYSSPLEQPIESIPGDDGEKDTPSAD
jgi:NADH:ubiquinone oxidoreductase subunit 5 (subunit L)/multisubunit Na+/H+ antiporter MnhA subunit